MAPLAHARAALGAFSGRTVPLERLTKQAAVAAVLRDRSGLEVLMIRRAEHPGDPWSGHMAFPGGRVDPSDAHPLGAAKREAHEEVALDLDRHAELIGTLSQVPAVAHGRPLPMVIHPFVFALEGEPQLVPDPAEVQETVWVPLPFLQERANREVMTHRIKGVPVKLPCYHFEGRRIWGLTLKMLDELMKVLRAG